MSICARVIVVLGIDSFVSSSQEVAAQAGDGKNANATSNSPTETPRHLEK
jgi:hypothetical protein